MTAIKQFFEQHEKPIKIQYPEQFDPKWVVMESGWPCFKLSALDNQPWDKMHIEAESLLEYFKDHKLYAEKLTKKCMSECFCSLLKTVFKNVWR